MQNIYNDVFFFNKQKEIIYINGEIKVSSAQGVPRRATVRSQKESTQER
jgi:hypothetical protein